MKELYTKPEIEIITIVSDDVITTSGGLGIHDRLPENDDPENQF